MRVSCEISPSQPSLRLVVLLWLCFVLLQCGCANQERAVIVRLQGVVPADAARVVIESALPDHAGRGIEVAPGTERVALIIPELFSGDLTVRVTVLDAGDCRLMYGESKVFVASTGPFISDTAVRLDGLATALCPLTLTVSGSGAVVERENALCTSVGALVTCRLERARGEALHLEGRSAARSISYEWSGPCEGTSSCAFSVDRATHVALNFRARICHTQGLCWYGPAPQGYTLHGAWAAPSGEMWTVGENGTILHGSSGFFSTASARTDLSGYTLRSIWGSSSTDIWAVGDGGIVVHFDGTEWTVDSKGSGLTKFGLRALWGRSAKDVWAVGERGTILRFDGAEWRAAPQSLTVNDLLTVWGTGASTLLAAGANGTLLRADNETWTAVSVPTDVSAQALVSIAGRSIDDVWIAADHGAMLRMSGGAPMSDTQAAMVLGGTGLRAVVPDRELGAWAVGDAGVVLRYTGGKWSRVSDGNSLQAMHLNAAVPDGETLVAFGETGVIATIQNAQATAAAAPKRLYGVWGARSDLLWAVGEDNTVSRFDGASWTPSGFGSGQPNTNLLGIWGFGAADIWTVGEGGAIGHYDGSAWSFVEAPATTKGTLYGIWGASPKDIWAVGAGGAIWHYNGDGWRIDSASSSITSVDLYAVSGRGAFEAVAVGAKGTVLRFDGVKWTLLNATTLGNRTAYGVWATPGSGPYWIVGERGLLASLEDTKILSAEGLALTSSNLYAIRGTSASDVWSVGAAGTVLHFDGKSWNPAFSDLHIAVARSLWLDGPGAPWLVGWHASPLRHGRGVYLRYLP